MEQRTILSSGPDRSGALSAAAIRARLAASVPGRRRAPRGPVAVELPDEVRGDHDLNPDMIPRLPLRPAAVLVPLVDRAEGFTILLTQRTEHLPDHAGQISFPGGRIDAQDADAEAAALREAEEEIGLARKLVEPIGRLDTYITRTGYEVTPVVGLVAPRFTLTLNPEEVADAFELPLAFLLDPANRKLGSRDWEGVERHFWTVPWQDRFIWGATAGMLVNLAEILGKEFAVGAQP
jgi:8-oxo-dGTP pyrophosphatase MutT (NUDIX family)